MRFKYLQLNGYIGIYNGLGLEEIIIDFNKCKFNKTIIKGANGSGKSTILKALSPLPDSNSDFIPGKYARKIIDIEDNGSIYRIVYEHNIKNNGERETTKGYIYKDGSNLNPNGNISSCKDILFSQFSLDSNFIALSQLSSEDRGLVDKKPAERKRFINNIINTLEVYNNIYKTLSKKSSIFKSNINSLTQKIDYIGDEVKLNSTMESLSLSIDTYNKLLEQKTKEISQNEVLINTLDKDGKIQLNYKQSQGVIEIVKNNLESIESKIKKALKNINAESTSNIMNIYDSIKKEKSELEVEIQIKESNISRLLSDREEELKRLQEKIQKVDMLYSDIGVSDIDTTLNNYKVQAEKYRNMFREIGIESLDVLSKDEYIMGLNTLKDIKDTIETFKSNFDYDIMDKCIRLYINDNTQLDNIQELENRVSELKNIQNNLKEDYNKIQSLRSIISILDNRPNNCKIDSCSFISSAINAKNELDKLKDPTEDIKNLEEEIINLVNKIEYTKIMYSCINYIKNLLRYINNYGVILKKLPNGDIFSNKDKFLHRLLNGDHFDDIYEIYTYIEYANQVEQYNIIMKDIGKLESEKEVYYSKYSIIESIESDIESLNNSTNKLTETIEAEKKIVSDDKIRIMDISELMYSIEYIISLMDEFNKEKEVFDSETSKIVEYREQMDSISKYINNITSLNNECNIIRQNISDTNSKLDKIKHALYSLQEYKQELDMYIAKYTKVEKIKFYSSPNTGIGTIFIEIYMNKILSTANQLLSYLFEGKFNIQPFIISETEFRIPCTGNGIMNDDISSMSTAQICMISMIISFSLLYQSSSKYNILRLDEIDGGLDTQNRLQFIMVLDELMNLLHCEQVILISHNNELNQSMCDIISLNSSEDFEGNIIFKY